MGVSTDGILFFGFNIHDPEGSDSVFPDGKAPDWLEDDWEDEFTRRLGLAAPDYQNKAAWRKWCEDKRALMAKHGAGSDKIGISTHCSGDLPIYFVHARRFTASRGYARAIDPSDLVVSPEEIEKLKAFCKLMDIPWQEPKWFLASLWS